jgi:hypothetical protein
MGALVRCTDGCVDGWMDPDRSVTVAMPKMDADGQRVLNREGVPQFVYMRRIYHVLMPSTQLALPLVPASCEHGLPEHPDPEHNARFKGRGRSWIKSRYVLVDGKCVVDRGDPRPDDLTCGLPVPPRN